jgi:hypothetical protein
MVKTTLWQSSPALQVRRLTPPAQVVHNASVRVRKALAAALLLIAAAMGPGLVWAGAHVHHHDHEAESVRDLAEVLVHGHEHQEGTPDHEHSVLPSPAVRQDAPGSAQVPEVVLETRTGETSSLSMSSTAWQLPRLDGPSPPILHLLCTLLI